MSKLEALDQSIEFWEGLAETGLGKQETIEGNLSRFGYLRRCMNRCPCCEFTKRASSHRKWLTRVDCIRFCPADKEVNFCAWGSPTSDWTDLWNKDVSKERLKEAALKVLEVLKQAKTRLGAE